MDYALPDEMRMLQDMAYKFAQQEIAPLSHKHDLEESYTPEIRKKAAENGLVAAWVPEEYGGAGVGVLGNSLIVEQISRIDMGIGLNIYAAGFGLEALNLFGTEDQKKTFLPPVCAGEKVWAGAYTEPNAGTDVAGYTTRAVKEGGDYVINGQKMFITNGTVCDYMLCQCVTHPEEKRHSRFSQIIIPSDTPGVTRNKIKGKMGIRANDTADIALEDVRVPIENIVGGEKKGFYQLMTFFDITRIMVSAQALGLSQGCLDEAVKYAKERTAFGQPIGNFQITMQKLSEMAIRIEALRNLVYKASWSADSDKPDYVLGSMAKYYGGQTAVFCANAAVEIHGGYGYIDEYKVQKWYRDAKILEL
ncbi:MAG: acyl-CoA/acyl-ACP dehydrogenase, partial [Syntrophales bacterium]|nr:acyl-CoA/acyl-ACP dehydrogenase [Syntrophales bacterium]